MKSFFLTLILIPLIALGWFAYLISPINPNPKKQEFTITKGQDIDLIGKNLQDAGLIRSPLAFKVIVYLNNLSSKIQAGYFSLSASDSTQDIAKSLTKALSKQVMISIPEGLRRQEVANIIIDKLQTSKLKHTFNPDLFISQTVALEGQLFPAPYAFPENVDTKQAIDLLHSKYLQVLKDLKIVDKDITRITILASLIEKEAGQDSERAEISGGINNRLTENWPIQIDATIQYFISNNRCRIRICDWWPKDLTQDDLILPSPYNTYKYVGLPPGPISNPSLDSIMAAIEPAKSDYMFFLTAPDGTAYFAKNLDEHIANRAKYLE